MSKEVDEDFGVRLQKAADHAHVPYKQTEIANHIGDGATKQKVDGWMKGGLPRADMLYKIADAFKVDARWLATGDGEMVPSTLPLPDPQEADLLLRYRDADPRWQLSLRLLACVATEDQFEAAGDVNVVLARIFGKKPGEMRYVSNERMEREFGKPSEQKKPASLRIKR